MKWLSECLILLGLALALAFLAVVAFGGGGPGTPDGRHRYHVRLIMTAGGGWWNTDEIEPWGNGFIRFVDESGKRVIVGGNVIVTEQK